MALLPSLAQAARTATSGLPRLHAAARRSGASRREAAAMVGASVTAFVVAARRHPHAWRQQNAVRHFVWQAVLTARHGVPAARTLAHAQERGSRDPADTAVDRANNAAGQAYGAAHAAELRRGSLRAVVTRLVAVADAEWRAGRLSSQPRRDA